MISHELKSRLYNRCTSSINSFGHIGKRFDTPDGQLVYLDRGAKVLGVAHLDCVLEEEPTFYNRYVMCGQLDDRLGVFTLMDLLPTMGLTFDILLTEGEESGRSTAQYFTPKKDYNWIFEFDRSGTDVVMYQYDHTKHRSILEDMSLEVGLGSFSDIAYLDHLGVAGFNFGTGYYNEHTKNCFADLLETIEMANHFKKFFRKYEDTLLPDYNRASLHKHDSYASVDTDVIYDTELNIPGLNLEKCETCGSYYEDDCDICGGIDYETCEECWMITDKDDLIDIDGRLYCENCVFGGYYANR